MLTTIKNATAAASPSAQKLRCWLNRHAPRGYKAQWNGAHYVSRCEHCDRPIRRVSQGKWVGDASVAASLVRPSWAGR